MRSRIVGLCGIAIVLLSSGFSADKKSKEDQTIRVRVEMVSLPVVVTDKVGRRVTDLKKEDFQVFEDGVQQEISGFAATDEPIDVALLLDTSGSTERELAKIQNAAISFVNQLHPDDEVAVISFSDDVKLQEDFTIDRDKNEYGIKKTRTGDCTTLYEAVWLGLEDVLKPIRQRKAMVLFTDGVDSCSRKASSFETLDLSKETEAPIYCVYYDTEMDPYKPRSAKSVLDPRISPFPFPSPTAGGGTVASPEEYRVGKRYLTELAENSGGVMLDGADDLQYAFAQVARELASQYSIGYYSNNSRNDGKFRKIQVKVNKPGLVVRTKKGYSPKKEKK
jgi:Ca-activated chloride channel homolog